MKEQQLDNTDREILLLLRENCRRSFRALAKEIGINPATLIERIKRLEKNNVIVGYAAGLDFLRVGYEFMGLVNISIEPGHLPEAEEKISKMKGVYAVYDVTGEYDAAALILAKSRNEFSALIKRILNAPHVKRTNTSVVLNVVKDPFLFKEV